MSRDPGRRWIEKHVNAPMVSYDWSSEQRRDGLIEEWRKVREIVRRRRGKLVTGSIMWKCCEEALALLRFVEEMGEAGALGEAGDWTPTHTILARIADLYERKTGKIDPMVQAIVREAMDEAYVSERFGR